MKIALFTIWHEMNYGAEMQAYATIKALTKLGHNVTLIDLRLDDIKKKSVVKKVINAVSLLFPYKREFQKFWNLNFPKTIRYKSYEILKKNPPNADVYLVGSDQTWNPEIMKSLYNVSLLKFGASNVIRASYASSFGINSWNFSPQLTEETRKAFLGFKYLSCREKTGCKIIKDIFHIDCTNVLDPTLLHTDYSEITGPIVEKNILVYYPLSDKDKDSAIYAKKIAIEMGVAVENANESQYLLKRILWRRTSIVEWIKKIASSQFVVTKSFHGLAFSIIYKRQFAIIINKNTNRSSRIKDLLSLLELESRCFSSMEEMMESRIWERKINYDLVYAKLELLRLQSWTYLKSIS